MSDLNNNQENQGNWGGKRDGAGRPKGSYNKPQIRNFFTDEEIESFVIGLKGDATSSEKIRLFLAEQLFGKARQNIGLDGGEDGEPIKTVFIPSEIADKNNIQTENTPN